ncbi:hypothetical protein GCM10022243_66000 [Saccharothrix violaceirubra]
MLTMTGPMPVQNAPAHSVVFAPDAAEDAEDVAAAVADDVPAALDEPEPVDAFCEQPTRDRAATAQAAAMRSFMRYPPE